MLKTMDKKIKDKVEAVIFSCGRKISVDEISMIMDYKSKEAIQESLKELQNEYHSRDGPLRIFKDEEGWQLTIKEEFLPLVKQINPNTEFSKQIMETLAVIAWKQPILQSEVISIRTPQAYNEIKELEKMGFITKEKYKRTFLIKLTQKFFDYFDLEGMKDIKELFHGFKEEDAQKKMHDFEQKHSAEINKNTGSAENEVSTEMP